MRLLLVEDSSDLRYLYARLLKRQGYEVCAAANGQEALDLLVSFGPDIVLTDLMMPHLDGFELIRHLRAMPEWDEVPVVAMTAAPSGEVEYEALRMGASDVLIKPIDVQMLLDCLVKCIH